MHFAFSLGTTTGGDVSLQSEGTAILARVAVRNAWVPGAEDFAVMPESIALAILPTEGRVMRCEVPSFKAVLFNVYAPSLGEGVKVKPADRRRFDENLLSVEKVDLERVKRISS